MKTNSRHGWLLVAAIFSYPTLLSQSIHAATQDTDQSRLGKVEFPTSCNEKKASPCWIKA